jgi:hypothetical protein
MSLVDHNYDQDDSNTSTEFKVTLGKLKGLLIMKS